jgi:hypothetical protein
VESDRDPVCRMCFKPIRPGTLVVYEYAGLLHVGCRSLAPPQSADVMQRAAGAQRRAAGLVVQSRRQRQRTPRRAAVAPPTRRTLSGCPLCGHSATLSPRAHGPEWTAVEGCPCHGFVVSAPLVERLRALSAPRRENLSWRVRALRIAGHEAWLTTLDGTVTGALVVRTARPERPA